MERHGSDTTFLKFEFTLPLVPAALLILEDLNLDQVNADPGEGLDLFWTEFDIFCFSVDFVELDDTMTTVLESLISSSIWTLFSDTVLSSVALSLTIQSSCLGSVQFSYFSDDEAKNLPKNSFFYSYCVILLNDISKIYRKLFFDSLQALYYLQIYLLFTIVLEALMLNFSRFSSLSTANLLRFGEGLGASGGDSGAGSSPPLDGD